MRSLQAAALKNFNESRPHLERNGIITTLVQEYRNYPDVVRSINRYRKPVTKSADVNDDLGMYLRDLNQFGLLNKRQTVGLFADINRGVACYRETKGKPITATERQAFIDLAVAYQVAFSANMAFVVNTAKTYQYVGSMPLIDLCQEGGIGLDYAVKSYDVERGYTFSTYAVNWIRQAIKRAIAAQGRSVKIPMQVYATWLKLDKTTTYLYEDLQREPNAREIAEHCGMKIEDVHELRHIDSKFTTSLNTPFYKRYNSDVESNETVADTLWANNCRDVEDELTGMFDYDELRRLIVGNDALSAADMCLISARSGIYFPDLNGLTIETVLGTIGYRQFYELVGKDKNRSFKAIGKLLDVTGLCVSQRMSRAIVKVSGTAWEREMVQS